MHLNKIVLPSLVIGLLVIGHYSFAQAKEYDGLWFLGFNLKSPLFKHLEARQAVNLVLDKNYINKNLASAEVVPQSLVPPGMLGYDPDIQFPAQNVKEAKLTLKKAGFLNNDKRIKNLTLLHTDGVLTIAIANKISFDLAQLGIKLKMIELRYQDEEQWVKALQSGNYDLYLMGYKADLDALLSTTEATTTDDSATFLTALFQSQGDANFSRYNNPQVDKLLVQLAGVNPALKEERDKKLRQINRQLVKDLPIIGLFYIERL